MIVKKLLQAWQDKPAGETVVLQDDDHTALVDEAIVEPTSTVRKLIDAWEDPDGNTHAAGTRVELDATTMAELQQIGVLGPTAI